MPNVLPFAPASPVERLTAFEFMPTIDLPQVVRLTVHDVVVAEFNVLSWLAVSHLAIAVETREALIVEGHGLGRPYWNDEPPPWTLAWNPECERQRIELIRRAAYECAAKGSILLM